MSKGHRNASSLQPNDGYPEEIIGQYVMELPVFAGKKLNSAPHPQRKKKILKPIRLHTLSASKQQCTSKTPYQTSYINRTGIHSNTSNLNNVLSNDQILRIKQLENELVESRMKIRELIVENRLLKTLEKRHENALSVYEGSQAKLPQVMKSYEEDIRTLQSQIRKMKTSYTELEKRYRSQSSELLVLQKQHKHLLELSKDKQLIKKEKLSQRLEEAQNIIKQQENQIQKFMKKLELQNKTHKYHITTESVKVKELLSEINHLKEKNQRLESRFNKLNFKKYSVSHSFVKGITEDSISITPRVKSTYGQDDEFNKLISKSHRSLASRKPESSCEDSEDGYQNKNVKIKPNKETRSNIIKESDIQINDKPYSSSKPISITLMNRGLINFTENDKSVSSDVENNDLENQNEQIVKPSHSFFENSMSRVQKDLLLAKLNQVSEDKDKYNDYYASELKKSIDKRLSSIDSRNTSDSSSFSD